jgi:hypothetical protein
MKLKNGMKVISTITRGNYLKKGNEYFVENVKESKCFKYSFDIIDDSGAKLFCLLEKCNHLNGDNWIIKNNENPT